MLVTLGIFTMLLAAVTKPLWWDHVKPLIGKDKHAPALSAPADNEAKK